MVPEIRKELKFFICLYFATCNIMTHIALFIIKAFPSSKSEFILPHTDLYRCQIRKSIQGSMNVKWKLNESKYLQQLKYCNEITF